MRDWGVGGGGAFGNLRFAGVEDRRDTSRKIHEQPWVTWDWVEKEGNMADKKEAYVSYSKYLG